MIGNLKISPVTQKSSELVYQFYENKTSEKHENILFIGLSKKSKFSFLLAVDNLTRLLKNDLLKTDKTHLQSFEKGDKIIFFESKRAKFISFNKTTIRIKTKYYGNEPFKKTESLSLPILYGSSIKKYKGSAKTLHTIKHILTEAGEKRGSITARDKLFLTNQSSKKLGVPSGLLKSKVLLITGNGNKFKFKKWAGEIEIYGEDIASIFKDNLVIEKDLGKFKDFFSIESISKRKKYNCFANARLFELANDYPDLEDDILELIFKFERGDYNEENLVELRENIKTLFGEELNIFNVLIGRLPSFSSPLPSGLKMVIIDSLETTQTYKNVIEGLANLKIKIVCTYDLNDFTLSNPFPLSPRYFWNREKIRSLNTPNSQGDIVDKQLWNRAQLFSDQNYKINIYDDDGFAELYWIIYNQVKSIEGKENLVKIFWTKIHPLFYLIKNSPNLDEGIKIKYLESIRDDLIDIKTDGSEIESLFQVFIRKSETLENKKVLKNGNVLSQEITIASEALSIPNNVSNENLIFFNIIKTYNENIIVTGIPYKEYQLKLVDDLIKNCFVRNINFLCWQREYSYLNRIIQTIEKSEWRDDNSIATLAKYSECPIETENQDVTVVEDHIRTWVPTEENNDEYEVVAQQQSSYYHSKYKGDKSAYTKKSVTVYLKSNQWIYIPNNDKIYFFDRNKNTISQKKGNKLNKSDIIVLFNISKRDLRDIGSSNENMDRVFEDLEIWSNALYKLFEGCNKNYATLENTLKAYKTERREKANPNKVNLSRWLDDNDLTLAPWIYNLEVILDAADLGHEKQKIIAASKKISKYESQFRKNIKKEILRRSREFIVEEDEIITKSITVNGVLVKVTSCKVLSIDKEILDIDNSYVKKII